MDLFDPDLVETEWSNENWMRSRVRRRIRKARYFAAGGYRQLLENGG